MKSYATLFALLSASSLSGQAQTTYTWDGGNYSTSPDNNWGTAINWSSDTVPVKSSNTILTFSGNEKATSNNNLGDWALDIGQLNFNSTTMGPILTGNAFGFLPLNGSQQINQNSAYGARIGNTFAFRSGSDSQINLNASGPLHVDSTVYLDASSGTARQLVIGGTTNDLNTLVVNGTIAKSGSGYDPDMFIQNNKRVAVFGALTFGSGTDGSVMINSGRLEFHGTGSMTGAPVIGSSSGSDSAMLLLNSDGQTMANQLEIRGGSTGRRVIGGQNTSGNVTFSGTVIASNAPASYDVVAATGGSVTLSGTRNFNSVLNINRPDGGTTYGGTVVLSGTSTSTSGVAVYGGTLSVGADSQLGGSGAITLDGGTLKQSTRFSTARNIVLGSNGGKIDTSVVDAYSNPWLSGAISGSGNLEIAAHGSYANATDRLQLTGNSTFIGSTTITSGFVSGSSPTAFGDAANTVVLKGGGLSFNTNQTHSYKISLASAESVLNVGTAATASANAAAAISGTGGLQKQGAGILFLAAANPYSGATRAAAGTLNLGNTRALSMSTLDLAAADTGVVGLTISGTNTYHLGGLQGTRDLAVGANSLAIGANHESTTYAGVLSGQGGLYKTGNGALTLTGANTYSGGTAILAGTLRVGDGGSTGSLAGNVTNNATLAFNRSDASAYAGIVSGRGALSKTGAGTLTLTGENTYSGGTTISAGTLQVGDGGTTGSLGGNVTNNATLAFNLSTNATTYAGIVSGTGALTKAGNSTLSLSGANTYSGGTTIAAGSLRVGNGGTTGSLAGDVTNNGTFVFYRSDASTYAGAVSGTGTLVQTGAGTLTLSGASTYSGFTLVAAGTLQLGHASALGAATGDLMVDGTLDLNAYSTAKAALSGTGTITSGAAGSSTFTNAGSAYTTFEGVIQDGAGTVALTKAGYGGLYLTGANTYTGGTTISAGSLWVGNGGTTGSIAGNVISNAALLFSRSDALTYAGVVSGSGELYQTGTGTLTLSGASTYSGTTVVSAGTLKLGNESALGTATGDLTVDGTLDLNSYSLTKGSLGGSGTITSGANGSITLTSSSNGGNIFSGVIQDGSGTVAFIKAGSGSLYLSGANTYTGGTTISGGFLGIGFGGTKGSLVGDVTNDGKLAFNRSNASTYAGIVSGSGALIKYGAGTLTLSGESTYSGATSLNSGTLKLGNASALGAATGTLTVYGTLDLNAYSLSKADLSGEGTITSGAAGSSTLTTSGDSTFSGVIQNGSGTVALTKAGTGTLTLAGESTYSGATTVAAGTLQLGNAGALGAAAGTLTVDGTLDLNAYSTAKAALSGNGTITSGAAGSSTLTTSGAGSSTFTGVIEDGSGTVALTKAGAGTLTLTGANTYSGLTTVSAGSLVVNGSIATSSLTTVQDGGILSGSGTVGALTVASSGTLAPGNSPGALAVTGNLTWLAGGNYNWQLANALGGSGSAWDTVNITGALDLTALSSASPFNLNLWSLSQTAPDLSGDALGFDPAKSFSWTIASADGGISGFDADSFTINTGATNGTAGFSNDLGGGSFSLAVDGANLNLVFSNVSAVPEPTGVLALAGLLAGGLLTRRRTQRVA